MKYIITFILLLPLTTSAQLSSENFQVDGYSVGSTQSTNASSTNFQTDRESGGRFELEGQAANEELQSKNIVGRVATTVAASEAFEENINPSTIPDERADSPTESMMASPVSGNEGDGFFGEAEDDTIAENAEEGLVEDQDMVRTEAVDTEGGDFKFAVVEIKYFWLWWFLLLMLAVYTARKLAFKNVDTRGRLK